MANMNPVIRRSAFDLGRALNEFHWGVVNVVVGGIDGTTSLESLDRVGVLLEAVAAVGLRVPGSHFDELRGDWSDYVAMNADWGQTYAEALQIYTEETNPGDSPAERVLAHLWSFVDQYRRASQALVDVALMTAAPGVKSAYSLGVVLDQGVRPRVELVAAEVAPSLGYASVGTALRVPTLREFVRELPNPEHEAWRRAVRGDGAPSVDEPPATIAAPYPRQPGDLPPTSSWGRTVPVLWEAADLDRFRHLPPDLADVSTASPAVRVARVELVVRLAHDAFDNMRAVPSSGPTEASERDAIARLQLDQELEAKLTGCSPCEKLAYLQYHHAALHLANEEAGAADRRTTDQAAYRWLIRHGETYGIADLPKCDTWVRYLRTARRKAGESKNRPRRGRGGRSITRGDGGDE